MLKKLRESKMTELKTLKDFEDMRLYRSKSCQLLMRRLKAESIKWVKFNREVREPMTEHDFRKFFNLTEEDLK